MKTTIDFPEDLLYRAKIVAAQRKMTLKELVFQGLDHAIRHPLANADTGRRDQMKHLLQAMRAANKEPMEPLSREEIHDR